MLFRGAKIHFSDRTYNKKPHFSDRTYNEKPHFSDRTYDKTAKVWHAPWGLRCMEKWEKVEMFFQVVFKS